MEYEVINDGSYIPNDLNIFCPGVNALCPNIGCGGDINILCGGGGGGDEGNIFPCENPGMGCRHGCGGASSTMCSEPY